MIAIDIALAALLIAAAIGDLRRRTIPNWLNIGIAVVAPLWWMSHGLAWWPDVAVRIGIALIVFGLFAGAFALGMMGGGDVKMIAALSLIFAPAQVVQLLVAMAIAGGAVTLATLIVHRARKAKGAPEVPYGVAIAAAGLLIIANDILTNLPS